MRQALTRDGREHDGNVIAMPGRTRQFLRDYTLPVLIGLCIGISAVIVPKVWTSVIQVDLLSAFDGAVAPPPSKTNELKNSSNIYQRYFIPCGRSNRANCIIDGDTFRLDGEKIRIADIDTPEIHPSRCTREETLGQAAKQRLQDLLNAGPFSLQSIARDQDTYGRKLRVVIRNGQSLGQNLVLEGLARSERHRRSWCN
jgi:endonuclease YncB( thermonuclease family)